MALFSLFGEKTRLPGPGEAMPGRPDPIPTAARHRLTGLALKPPYPAGTSTAIFGLGCFWGAERLYWRLPGVVLTAVGYAGGETPNPTYAEVCSGRTGHTEVVLVVFDPALVSYDDLLRVFWEAHDPTQGMRQGNDVGTQYRSAIYTTDDAQAEAARASATRYDDALRAAGHDALTTEIRPAPPFYFAEAEHQQYLDVHPNGYCGLRGTGVACPLPTAHEAR
ncbi:MAG: peptide-methionine (S)-S-oxide reductase MsrA [Siculibacillus sp.]